MILNAVHINKAFGSRNIIEDASFFINENEKAAIVGLNGAGKTTLLRILSGEIQADSGSVILSKDAKLGYLHQINDTASNLNIKEELYTVIAPIIAMEERMELLQEQMKSLEGEALEKVYEEYNKLLHAYELADGYQAKSRVTGILKGLGFDEDDFDKKISMLSGGQKTRVFLGKLLLEEPDIILLDEPTNHLDLSSIEWLETYLMNYRGAVIIVSHDRYFLDRVVTKVIDIDNASVNTYIGSYFEYSDKKAMLRDAALKAYINQQQEIRHQEAVIEKLKAFNREKSIKRAESREKMLDKIERLDKPSEVKSDMSLFFSQSEESGQDVLKVDSVSKAFGENKLFQEISFEIKRGEHIAIIGDNGTGKTTMLKIINGMLPADSGEVIFGSRVFAAYYDQEHQVLHMEKTLFDEISDEYPDMTNTEIRNILAAFLFTGDDVFKRISELSGGERGRVSLAKLMLSKANFLILDEPTNHLDIVSKEILERAIQSFNGTVLYVSHDRYFINKTASRILDLKANRLLNYIGNYDYYMEKREAVEAAYLSDSFKNDALIKSETSSWQDWKAGKEEQARQKRLKNAIAKCEGRIHELEVRLNEIDEEFALPENQTDAAYLQKLQKEKESIEDELASLYENWEELAEEDALTGGEK